MDRWTRLIVRFRWPVVLAWLGRRALIVLAVVLVLAAPGCGGHSRPLADGEWYGKLSAVNVAHRALSFAPACSLDRSGRWIAVADRSADPITVGIAPKADLEVYFRPNGETAAGHAQPAGLRLLADVASHGRNPNSPPGWFVSARDGVAVSVQEDSGIRSSGKADKQTFACVWSASTQAFVNR
jgi:hypothetical protein